MRRVVFILALGILTLSSRPRLQGQMAAKSEPGKLEVYFVPFSHLDFFWAGTREECLSRGNRIIAKAVQIAQQHPEFRFFLEDNNFLANYMESHAGSAELEDFKRLVKEGRLGIAPKWAAIFQNLPNGEVLSRNLAYGKRYARTVFGVDPQVAHLGDLPGFTPQFPQMLAKAGIPYMVMTRMGPPDKWLFYWKSPDGSKALVWNEWKGGYGWGSALGLHRELTEERRNRLAKELEQARASAPGPVFLPWGVDLWAPTEKLVENINALNRDFTPARFIMATPDEFFRRVARTPGLPELAGEIPSAWPHTATSIPHLWQLAVPAMSTLISAEKFAAVNYALGYADYPQQELDFLWKKLIESMDHNHNGQGGIIGDTRKMEYSRLPMLRGGEILRDSLRNIAERVEIPILKSFPIVVFNPLGWRRDDLVRAHVTLYGDVSPADIAEYRKGLNLVDEKGKAVPFHVEQYSENISRALELVFVANDVPSLGYKTYYLTAAQRPEVFPNTSTIQLDREKDLKDPRRPLGVDLLENAYYRVTVDKASGRVAVFDKALKREVSKDMEIVGVEERGGNNVAYEIPTGRTIPNSVQDTAVEENNAVRTVLRITGQIADIPIAQRLILYQGLKRLDIENSVEWKGPRFLNLEQLFPLVQPGAKVHYGVPFGAHAAEQMIPGAGPHATDELKKEVWEKYRQIQDWISAGTSEWTLSLAADHQVVGIEDNLIRGDMIRGQRFTSIKVVRGDEVTVYQYPVPGSYLFKFSLSSGSGDWRAAKSYQSGMALNTPLIAVSVEDELSRKSLPPSRSFCSLRGENLVLSAVKKADLEPAVVLRLYEIQGSPGETPVEFLGKQRSFREVNLLEEESQPRDQQVLKVGPYEVKTLKLRIEK